MPKSALRRGAVVVATGAALALACPAFASAHVTVSSPAAGQGGYGVLTFRVPNESATASTTSVSVTLPGFNSALTKPLAGWTAVVDKDAQEHATKVTWTADGPGSAIAPGQFQTFDLSAGPLPETDTLSLPAVQTYSDGQVVDWDQQQSGDNEPEYPAPSLTLSAPASGDAHHGGATPAASQQDSSDSTARWLGGGGLVAGVLGLVLGAGAWLRGRK